MTLPRALSTFLFLSTLLVACGDSSRKESDSLPDTSSVNKNPASAPNLPMEITAQTFAVKDSTGKEKGWGYDLYVDGKRTIHQPMIPAVPGTAAFASEADAKKTGELAVQKMKKTGVFPTLSIHELDSLGIKHQ